MWRRTLVLVSFRRNIWSDSQIGKNPVDFPTKALALAFPGLIDLSHLLENLYYPRIIHEKKWLAEKSGLGGADKNVESGLISGKKT